MFDYSQVNKFDSMEMHKIYAIWPKIAKEAYESELPVFPIDENIEHIVFAGMGGSGSICDLLFSILSKTNIHVACVKGYVLPKTVNSKSLVVGISISGDAVETLHAIKTANEIGCKIICFSVGGKLEQYCNQNSIEHRKVQYYANSRSSFPSAVYTILNVLKNIMPVNKESIKNSILQMEILSEKISTKNLSETNPSLSLANWLNEISLIYYPHGLQAVSTRFKNSIQENMKCHAMIEDIIETCHNGIVSWEVKSNIKPILIQETGGNLKTKERWEIIKSFFKENNIDYWEVHSIKGDTLSKNINLIYLLDMATIYKAILEKIDPYPTKSINFVKSHIS